jgi:hypothetical protein
MEHGFPSTLPLSDFQKIAQLDAEHDENEEDEDQALDGGRVRHWDVGERVHRSSSATVETLIREFLSSCAPWSSAPERALSGSGNRR